MERGGCSSWGISAICATISERAPNNLNHNLASILLPKGV
jgi:hypothetical protein